MIRTFNSRWKRKGVGKGGRSRILMIIKTINEVHVVAVGCDTALQAGM